MGYVSPQDYALLDFRLALPEERARDEQRRQECHIPPEVRYQTRHEQCLEMIDEWAEQVSHGWVTGDDELGRHTRFRQALRGEAGAKIAFGILIPLWCRRGVKTTPIAVPNAAGESGWGRTRVIRGLRFSEAGAKIAFGILIPQRRVLIRRRRCLRFIVPPNGTDVACDVETIAEG
jgi:hypothetical protein